MPSITLAEIAPAFVEMAHRIVWCTVATVDPQGRARSRVLHPIWAFDGDTLTGWIATSPQSPKAAHLEANPTVSCTYWTPAQDTCTAECDVRWRLDSASRHELWDRLVAAPAPLGYDPRLIPAWTDPDAEAFGVLELTPWRLRVMPGSVMMKGEGELLDWRR